MLTGATGPCGYNIVVTIFPVQKLRQREVKGLANGHKTSKRLSFKDQLKKLNPKVLTLSHCPLIKEAEWL